MKKEYDLRALKKRPGKVKIDPDAAKIPINLRLDGSVIGYFKTEVERLGLPYQTLVSSILHQYASDELIERKTIDLLRNSTLLDGLS